jgi:hypothetical protein
MKITSDVVAELQKIRAAIDNVYEKLNVILYERVTAVKTTYKPINPSEKISENLSYISEKIRLIQESEVVGEE